MISLTLCLAGLSVAAAWNTSTHEPDLNSAPQYNDTLWFGANATSWDDLWNATVPTYKGGLPWTWDNATYSPWWATPVPSSSWCDRCPNSTRCVSLSGGMACVSHDYYSNHYDRYGSYNYNNHYNTYDSNYGYYSGSRHEVNGWKVAFWVLTAVVFAGLGTAATCWCCRRRKAPRGAVVGEPVQEAHYVKMQDATPVVAREML